VHNYATLRSEIEARMIEKMHYSGFFRPILTSYLGLFTRIIGLFICLIVLPSVLQAADKSLFTTSQLRIITAADSKSGQVKKPILILIELAASGKARVQGLQGRRFLAPNSGMLFDFIKPQIISMWMKNTHISLDMIFIGDDGRILHIAENTEPFSLKSVLSRVPARAVLELKAGSADRMGIEPGHHIDHPIFKKK
jgi:uncharacterized membrane protein (UPF0127 family)